MRLTLNVADGALGSACSGTGNSLIHTIETVSGTWFVVVFA